MFKIKMILCMEMIIKERKHLILPLLVGCGQFCVSFNQIALSISFEEIQDSLSFFAWSSHEVKVGCGTTFFIGFASCTSCRIRL